MADQKINALPSKTAPTTGDKMLMVGTAEEYLIDYDKLATAILNKLSSQSFSSLDTTAKTVLGAVNELNSKSLMYKKILTSNDSLSDYGETGIYGLNNVVINGESIIGTMISLKPASYSYQIIISANNSASVANSLLFRTKSSTGTWTYWRQVDTTLIVNN